MNNLTGLTKSSENDIYTEWVKTHKWLIIKQVVKRFGIKKGRNTEGVKNAL
jgi:hypothetical protein